MSECESANFTDSDPKIGGHGNVPGGIGKGGSD